MEHLPQEMPYRATLAGPSGSRWHVNMSKDEDGYLSLKGVEGVYEREQPGGR